MFNLRRLLLVSLGVAVVSAQAFGQGSSKAVKFLNQGWSNETRQRFYFTPQGSQIIRYDWFLALERPDGQGQFADSDYLASFGFLPSEGSSPLNPDGLPIGFAIDPRRAGSELHGSASATGPLPSTGSGHQLGLTCAACHTGNVTFQGRVTRVDGAPANIDFDWFISALHLAVSRTYFDGPAFQRFAARLSAHDSPEKMSELRTLLGEFQNKFSGEVALRRPTVKSGFGRVDALTQIINNLAVVAQRDPSNIFPVKAPTSFAHLWLSSQLEFVQWNPIAASPIGRNVGEVISVFGSTNLTGDARSWYSSSVLLRELHNLETMVAELKPPKWAETEFGVIDKGQAASGEGLFVKHCAVCHNSLPYKMTDPATNHFGKSFIAIQRIDYRKVGTDPVYNELLTGRLVRTNPATAIAANGRTIVPAADYFLNTVTAILGQAMRDHKLSASEVIEFNGFRLRPPLKPGEAPVRYTPSSVTDLKAGPLDGIWATAPYLHNGSVATIYELLSPQAERRAVFWTGGREIDRERVGFVSDEGPDRFRFDTQIPGNRNIGHNYPAEGLTPAERRALAEYIKTL